MQVIFLLKIILLFLYFNSVNALDIEINKNRPIEILSDEVRYLDSSDQAIFKGNVIITQDNLIIESPIMEVYFTKNKDEKLINKGASINFIYFKQEVKIKALNESASADRGEYNVTKGILKLNGNVILRQHQNVMTGEELTYVKDTGESLMKNNTIRPNKSRVKAYIIPKNN